jgi:hypothetical protein
MTTDLAKVLIPIIRRVEPAVIAQDIIGVQPMGVGPGYYSVSGPVLVDDKPWYTLRIWNQKVWHWLNELPTANNWCTIDDYRVDVSEEVLLLIKLRWPES